MPLQGSQPVELFGSDSDAALAAIEARLRGVYTSMPAIVKEDSDGHNVTAQPAINALVRKDDGTMEQLPWPPLQTIVTHFMGGGLMVETHPIKANDEGIVLGAARNIDSWRQSGGTQNPTDARQHHASDHFYLGGVKSDPNKIKNYVPDSIQHRSLDAKVTHDVHPTNGITHKVVPASDPSTNPFASATTFFQHLVSPIMGLIKTATDGNNLHTFALSLAGIIGQVKNSAVNHTFSCPVSIGPTLIGQQGGQTAQVLVNPLTGLQLSSTLPMTIDTPALSIGAGAIGSSAIGGASDGSDAAPGSIGEYATASQSFLSISNGIATTICTLTLSPGDWDVAGLAQFAAGSIAIEGMSASLTGGTSAAGGIAQLNVGSAVAAFKEAELAISPMRVNTTIPTTIALQMTATFVGGTVSASGSIRARRMR